MKKRYRWYLILPFLAVFFSGCDQADAYLSQTGYGAGNCAAESDALTEGTSAGSGSTETAGENAGAAGQGTEECVVHIGGAVAAPGVYRLEAGSRLIDAVELAGGLNEDACSDACNLAEILTDGMQYRIPTMEEAENGTGLSVSGASSYTADGRLDINRATAEELMTLSGIGASKAQAIVTYREEHGNFQSTEDIRQVSGIGDAVYAAISADITVR